MFILGISIVLGCSGCYQEMFEKEDDDLKRLQQTSWVANENYAYARGSVASAVFNGDSENGKLLLTLFPSSATTGISTDIIYLLHDGQDGFSVERRGVKGGTASFNEGQTTMTLIVAGQSGVMVFTKQ